MTQIQIKLQHFWWQGGRHFWRKQHTSVWQTNAWINTKENTCGEISSGKKSFKLQTQALLQLTGSLNQLIQSHRKRYKKQMNCEKERNKVFLEFKKQQTKKNQHKIGMAKIFAGACRSVWFVPPNMPSFYSPAISNPWCDPILGTVIVTLNPWQFISSSWSCHQYSLKGYGFGIILDHGLQNSCS